MFKVFALTDDLSHRNQSSKLRSGQPPPSYDATIFTSNNGTPPNRPGYDHVPHIPPSVAPGPIRPSGYVFHPTGRPLQKRTQIVTRGLALCLATILFQVVLIIYRSDSLAQFANLESAALRASMEKSALVSEREKSERERDKMRRDRELWEKVLEDRVPQDAFWEVVWPAWDCRAYGKREYWGMLQNIPEGWSAIDACMNMPVEIKGVTIRRPYRCAFVDGSPHIHGYWMVDWDQPDCKPDLKNFHDAVSLSFPFTHTPWSRSHVTGMHEL